MRNQNGMVETAFTLGRIVIRSRLGVYLLAAILFSAAIPSTGIAKSLRAAVQGSIASLDPHILNETFSLGILSNVMEGLVRRDANLNLQSGLATHWEQLTPKHWRFHLRRGVRFHDGAPFTAEDVIFSFKRAQGPLSQQISRIPPRTRIEAVNTHTVDFHLMDPNPILHADWEALLIMSSRWARAHGLADAGGTPLPGSSLPANGTGPYRVQSFEAGQTLRLKRNTDWWGGGAHRRDFDSVDLHTVRIAQTRTAALLSGQVDLIVPAPLPDLARIAATDGLTVITGPELRTIFLNMDQISRALPEQEAGAENPLRDIRVRRAIYQAINVEAIRRHIMRGRATLASTLISPAAHAGANEIARLPFDPAAARQLLKAAGYGDGFTLPMDCPNDRYVNDGAICEAVAGMLAKVGIRVLLNLQTKSLFFSKVLASGGYSSAFNLIGWTPGAIDGLNVLNNVALCRDEIGNGGRFNLGGYCNRDVDRLAAQAAVEMDAKVRSDMITRALKIIHDDVGFIPLHQQSLSWAMSRKIETQVRADNQIRFELIRLRDRQQARLAVPHH